MPTTRPRHMITETEVVSKALDDAAIRWPHARSRGQLLQFLLEEGHARVSEHNAKARAARLTTIAECAGALTGTYGPDYLEQLREEWPS